MVNDKKVVTLHGIINSMQAVNYKDNNNEDYSAPFRYIRNATIKNLHVAGKITKTKKRNAGGLVGDSMLKSFKLFGCD